VEGDQPHLEAGVEVRVAMMIHHHRTIMVLLQGRQHELATAQEAVEQGKSNGDLAFGLGLWVELPLDIWLGTEIDHANQRLNKEVEGCSVVELPTQEATAGLEGAVVMLERAVRDQTALVRQLRLQVGIRALASDLLLEGRPEDFII
jgi:hypothetical protein